MSVYLHQAKFDSEVSTTVHITFKDVKKELPPDTLLGC